MPLVNCAITIVRIPAILGSVAEVVTIGHILAVQPGGFSSRFIPQQRAFAIIDPKGINTVKLLKGLYV